MHKTGVTIRSIKISDISGSLSLSNAEVWNQTAEDWKFLIETPVNFCLLAEIDNKIVGTVTAMNYSNAVAWIGMVLVHKDYRGQGISKLLLTNIFKKTNSCKSVKLDATPAGQAIYEKHGFKDEYLIARMINPSVEKLSMLEYDIKPELIQLNDVREIAALDKIVFGAGRGPLIEYIVKQSHGNGWLLKRNNIVTGFILGRAGNKYHHIGPLVASATMDAEILISKALQNLINRPVTVDVLYDKENLINWLSKIGFTKERHFIRMYKNENHFPGNIDRQYLICGPEFG